MAYNYVTVNATYESSLGKGAYGRYVWFPSANIVDSVNNVNFEEPVQIGFLDANGSFSVSLLATDNPGLSPFHWVLVLYVGAESVAPTPYLVPFANGATQPLDKLAKA